MRRSRSLTPGGSRRGAVLEEGMTSTLCRKSKDETVTFHAHRFLWSDRLACANKIKVSVVNTTSDAAMTKYSNSRN
jgi:hypothetical protein